MQKGDGRMAYSELVKNFNRIRDYMREFYVYGFKSRDEYTGKSARSYDDERRRLESWLGDYMRFRQTPKGKNVFISIDSRVSGHNPLYKAWKAKCFTDGDITLHFLLFDILSDSNQRLTIGQIMDRIDGYLSQFSAPRTFDESTVRKKLKEYVSAGLLIAEKAGKAVYYRRCQDAPALNPDMLDYFSEVLPCGVIGSYLIDKSEPHDMHFAFKHHYITGTMDSEVIYSLLIAMREKRIVTLETVNRGWDGTTQNRAIPLKIMISAQSGRQYLMAYAPKFNRITAYRTDSIASVRTGDVSDRFDALQDRLRAMRRHIWGVSTQSRFGGRMEHVEFTVHYSDSEMHIRSRLEREKRCGTVEHLDDNTSRFTADVYDASEMIPWIRTFICRITDIHFSNAFLDAQFRDDIREMCALYGIGGDAE